MAYSNRRGPAARRAFTLVEVIVVVVIIAVLAVLAIPSLTKQMRERRTSQAAQEISTLYRNARMRALGRGSAVLVHYDDTNGFSVRESEEGAVAAAARGGTAQCQPLPTRGCLTNNWAVGGTFKVVGQFNPKIRGEFVDIETTVLDPANTPLTYLDICFTPVGRSFSRIGEGVALAPMNGIVSVNVKRLEGLRRTVVVLPNGISRLAESGS